MRLDGNDERRSVDIVSMSVLSVVVWTANVKSSVTILISSLISVGSAVSACKKAVSFEVPRIHVRGQNRDV